MGTLIEQINELIGVLEIVDPEAAAALRGGRTPEQVTFAGPRQTTESSLPYTSGMAPGIAEIFPTVQEIAPTVKDIAPHDSILNPLYVNLRSDSLIKGIIYSEILGMPVSRRHRYRG